MNNGQRNQMPPLRTGGPGGRGGPMLAARVNKEKPKNTKRTKRLLTQKKYRFLLQLTNTTLTLKSKMLGSS